MSTFAVTLRKLEKVWNHPQADRLDLAKVEGCEYQFVVGRDAYRPGDEVLFFPIDAVLPNWIIERIGLVGKLSGKDKNRIKTVVLRGAISQGIVARPETVMGVCFETPWRTMTPDELTKTLGVIKYEAPPVPCTAGNLVGMPDDVPVYDIEGADNFSWLIDNMMDKQVFVSEKLEGTNFWLSAFPNGEMQFGQRNHRIDPLPDKEHDFLRVAKKFKLVEFAHFLVKYYKAKITLRGEYLGPGIQRNIYGLKENVVYLFDYMIGESDLPTVDGGVKKGNRYEDAVVFYQTCEDMGIPVCPCLGVNMTLREWLKGKTVREASNGPSLLNPAVKREGIVIKPIKEEMHYQGPPGTCDYFGRLIIKQRSPEYLAESDF